MEKRRGGKVQMKCNKCRGSCDPQNGDWHEGTAGQVFLCRVCETALKPAKLGPRAWNFEYRSPLRS